MRDSITTLADEFQHGRGIFKRRPRCIISGGAKAWARGKTISDIDSFNLLALAPRLITPLNAEQRAAVLHPLSDPPLFVLGGAGSGKTSLLACRLAYLLMNGVPGERILALTFTRKAAGELNERLRELFFRLRDEVEAAARPAVDALRAELERAWITTFHAACLALLRDRPFGRESNLDRRGYAARSRLITDSERAGMAAEFLAADDVRAAASFNTYLSRAKGSLLTPADCLAAADHPADARHAHAYALYQKRLAESQLLDFDDLIFRTYELLRDDVDVRRHYQARFPWLLIDEYQDTSTGQFQIVELLATGLMAVGDDDQAIYAWRGASVANIARFFALWPGARLIKLERNYRSDAAVIEAANSVWRDKDAATRKTLRRERRQGDREEAIVLATARDAAAETAHVATAIGGLVKAGESPSEIAVLARARRLLDPVAAALAERGVVAALCRPPDELDAAPEADGVLALMTVMGLAARRAVSTTAWRPGDEECFGHELRVALGLPLFGCRPDALAALPASLPCSNLLDPAEKARRLARLDPRLAPPLERLVALVREALIQDIWTPSVMLATLRRRVAPDATQARRTWEHLAREAARCDASPASCASERILVFVEETRTQMGGMADAGERASDGTALGVRLMTLHAAKGLEFDSVFLIALEDGILPSRPKTGEEDLSPADRLAEEQRLFYVGLTRARVRLFLSFARHRSPHGARHASPFLKLIPERLLDRIRV